MLLAPALPRIGSTMVVVSCDQRGRFDASGAGETVAYSGSKVVGDGLLFFSVDEESQGKRGVKGRGDSGELATTGCRGEPYKELDPK